jgi:hypothetical protein
MSAHEARINKEDFIEWSIGDPDYADDGWEIGRQWDGLPKLLSFILPIGDIGYLNNKWATHTNVWPKYRGVQSWGGGNEKTHDRRQSSPRSILLTMRISYSWLSYRPGLLR